MLSKAPGVSRFRWNTEKSVHREATKQDTREARDQSKSMKGFKETHYFSLAGIKISSEFSGECKFQGERTNLL